MKKKWLKKKKAELVKSVCSPVTLRDETGGTDERNAQFQ
jgi:hypothetical protein